MEAIGRCCRNAYVQPFDRQKVIYICGAVGGVFLVVIVILTISTMSSGPSTPDSIPFKGSDVLKTVPLTIGFNNLPQNIKQLKLNKLAGYNFTLDLKSDKEFINCKTCQTDYTKLKTGQVAVQIWSANVDCKAEYKDAVEQTLDQIDVIQRLITLNSPDTLSSVTNLSEIYTNFAKKSGLVGSIISVNGGHSIDSRLSILRMYYKLGVRVMAITSSCNTPWAMSNSATTNTTADTGLKTFGVNVVNELNRLGIVIDLSSSSLQTQLSVLKATKAPVIFSHSAAAGVFSDTTNLNIRDEVLDELKKNKGLVMVTFSKSVLKANTAGVNITSLDVIAHLKHLKEKIGAEYIGIGGGYDVDETYPVDLEDISKIPALFDSLYKNSSWTNKELEGLAGKNFQNVLKAVEQVRDDLAKKAVTPDETWELKSDFDTKFDNSCITDFDLRP